MDTFRAHSGHSAIAFIENKYPKSFRQIQLISSLILCPTVASLLTYLNGDNGTATDPVSMHRRQISEKNGRGVHYIHYDYDPRRNDFESTHVNATLAALFRPD